MSVISKEALDSALCAESALSLVFAGFDRVARACAEKIIFKHSKCHKLRKDLTCSRTEEIS